ncbi:MAG: DegT/DnrJ/EryC1/StrS aminotransferase family protein [Pirellulales bacterium]|nr:DegT/DnrJ/EryC1/StrS aminotransferase family protein [Pirellulales bacterium]
MIEKTATIIDRFRRPLRYYYNARSAFKSLLAALNLRSEQSVLLPAYIGWSANEGSGVFDPIAELGLRFDFYRLDESLHIDLDHLESRLRAGNVKVLVLIHYFGYVDPQYRRAVELARRYGALVVEDEAHALFSDWVGRACGRLGDAAIFSLHKMLPIPGGMLAVAPRYEELFNGDKSEPNSFSSPWNYDFHAIAQRRRENARHLTDALKPLAEHVTPLRPTPADGEVPQTLPVMIHGHSRDALYFALNEAGFGAVSLYHTMIPQITEAQFPDAHRVSRRILNLPIHQDVEPAHLDALAAVLSDIFEGHRVCQPLIGAPRGASARKIPA